MQIETSDSRVALSDLLIPKTSGPKKDINMRRTEKKIAD